MGRPNSDIAVHAKSGAKASAKARTLNAEKRAADMRPITEAIKAEGNTSLRQIAAALNERGITTAPGGEWNAVQVKRVLDSAF